MECVYAITATSTKMDNATNALKTTLTTVSLAQMPHVATKAIYLNLIPKGMYADLTGELISVRKDNSGMVRIATADNNGVIVPEAFSSMGQCVSSFLSRSVQKDITIMGEAARNLLILQSVFQAIVGIIWLSCV